ncbi:phosphonate C-P lyase system protein PhnG [Ruegeria arenilitoris]|uniref:phosphonate C-P lyase system protein PhnG n=1 Tax=Ruegeria arenilitoris TaxID=1173585 RepID=UPI00147E6939|nr:phosphonate C-P lyase system protein PhnG [Ruegeria arenilitoris]
MAENSDISAEARRTWMGLLARVPHDALEDAWTKAALSPKFEWLRRPEVGGVMIQGRTGGTGAPFNLGEMTVTRCSLALQSGPIGHGYVQGRSKSAAEIAALVDALMQTGSADQVKDRVIDPLMRQMNDTKSARAAKAAATKVEFFTMVRGEDT